MTFTDLTTRTQIHVPAIAVLQLAVTAAKKRRGEAMQTVESAWQAYDAALEAGDPDAHYLGDLAEAAQVEALDAYDVLEAAKGLLLSAWN